MGGGEIDPSKTRISTHSNNMGQSTPNLNMQNDSDHLEQKDLDLCLCLFVPKIFLHQPQ
jgi:hypothetical protein